MSLRDKYAAAIHVAKSVGMQGAAEEANGRLQFKGTVTSEDDKNKIWDALKSVPTWKDDLNAQIDLMKVQVSRRSNLLLQLLLAGNQRP